MQLRCTAAHGTVSAQPAKFGKLMLVTIIDVGLTYPNTSVSDTWMCELKVFVDVLLAFALTHTIPGIERVISSSLECCHVHKQNSIALDLCNAVIILLFYIVAASLLKQNGVGGFASEASLTGDA